MSPTLKDWLQLTVLSASFSTVSVSPSHLMASLAKQCEGQKLKQ